MGYLQKEGLRPNLETPKTILDCNSAYKLRTKTMELPKLRTFKVWAPTIYVNLILNDGIKSVLVVISNCVEGQKVHVTSKFMS